MVRGEMEGEGVELGGSFALLDAEDGVALLFQLLHGFEGGGVVCPFDGVFCSEGGFVYFGMGGLGGDAAEVDGVDAEGVGGAEHAAYVVHAAHVVEDDGEGHFL